MPKKQRQADILTYRLNQFSGPFDENAIFLTILKALEMVRENPKNESDSPGGR